MKALSAAEMREVDRLTTSRFAISGLQLMEAAGKHVCDAVVRGIGRDSGRHRVQESRQGLRVAILCGKGNNGGDGLVAARHLRVAGVDAKVFVFGDPAKMSGDAGENLQRWRAAGGVVTAVESETGWEKIRAEIAGSHVVVDALLGTGLRGAATGLIARAISDVNELSNNATLARPALIFAVDIPSGLPSDGEAAEGPVLRSHKTVTFSAPKMGQLVSRDAATGGTLEVFQIGSPRELVEEVGQGIVRWSEAEEFVALPLVRAADSNKGSYGHVLLVAGSTGKSGAAVLAGRMALRGGAGLVTIALPATVLPIVASAQAEYMTEPLAATQAGTIARENMDGENWTRIEQGKSVLAIGPGLGSEAETQECIRAIVRKTALPVIVDADGLNAFAGRADELRERKGTFLAITPHPGEMARLLGCAIRDIQADRLKAAREAAQRWNAHVILKGFHTVVAAPDGRVFVNTMGNSGLAKGGTGDVLTGLLAALTSQFKTGDWLRVLALGVYLHGLAAEIAGEQTDASGLLAGDLTHTIGQARARLVEELQKGG